MGRRRLTQEQRKQETRQLLIESAIEIFAQLGFHGASVDKIAEHAGFSKGAVYAHFKSKEELFLAILERQMQLQVGHIRQVIERQHSISQFINAMDACFGSVKKRNRTWNMLYIEFLLYAMREEAVRHKWSRMLTESVAQISGSIKQLMSREKGGTPLSADDIAWTILSLENGLAIFSYIGDESMPPHLYKKALHHLLLPLQEK
ncbi:TetR family transcriptional regulator [Paenibacillus dendritiformis]|uniref:TetR/AcrR family transcriptional regulator n=1 Tax=Paenibacillus dendritiformis TaxID=130049 RepID=UPI0018CEBD22|nr:TetR/AcrR family transcriptional regulator [Paenibacillus dendritiformis]MBG9794502.1 TetR family transcriptional regulator [Paenibacillus dendritiformis]